MKTKLFSGIRYAYSVTTKWVSIEKYQDLRDLYTFSLKKFRKTETKTSGADSRWIKLPIHVYRHTLTPLIYAYTLILPLVNRPLKKVQNQWPAWFNNIIRTLYAYGLQNKSIYWTSVLFKQFLNYYSDSNSSFSYPESLPSQTKNEKAPS